LTTNVEKERRAFRRRTITTILPLANQPARDKSHRGVLTAIVAAVFLIAWFVLHAAERIMTDFGGGEVRIMNPGVGQRSGRSRGAVHPQWHRRLLRDVDPPFALTMVSERKVSGDRQSNRKY